MSNKKTRKNNKKHKKINIIFDIDETLIQAYNNEGGVLTSFNRGDYAIGKLDSGREYLIYKRPYLEKLMNFCYEYFYVSFWTSGKKDHCSTVLKNILTEKQFKKTKIIVARSDQNEFYEFKSDKYYMINLHNNTIAKPLDYLWEHPDFSDTFNRNNTVIVDDNPLNIAINQHNSIFIYPWCRFDKRDRKLKELIKLLKKYKYASNIRDIKAFHLHIPRTLSITNVLAHKCGFPLTKRETKKIISKFN